MGRALKVWWNFEDFIDGANNPGCGSWIRAISGTGAAVLPYPSTALRIGILYLDTGTTNAGSAAIYPNPYYTSFLFGGGVYTIEADIYINYLSTATETYTLRFGFGDSSTAAPTDGAYLRYTDVGGGTPTPNWYKCTVSNTSLTATDTEVAAVASAWTRLKVVVNAAATSVEYFINGTSVGVMTLTIPTGAGRETGAMFSMVKSVGTTSRTTYIDWAWLHVDLTTSR